MLALVGRLNPGADLPSAQAQATVVGERITSGRIDNYWRNNFTPRLSPLRDRVTGRVASAVGVLVGAVGFLMLVVCANLSSLLLARAMQGMLFEVAATDRLSFGIVVGVLAGVTLLAGYLPARRASRVDPSLALRA
jgi:hypothetical protein